MGVASQNVNRDSHELVHPGPLCSKYFPSKPYNIVKERKEKEEMLEPVDELWGLCN